ncbi:hypothetical protein D9757_001003 [Collybiopsis confluens]|uniref:Yeast cell wall synthesis Kre9/Knh1-like N-terminal domain-containing protein n=1 Tax=Collybiopsis confluens TaxID=2823264 RepID=A0A8H5MG70_9AGAR|nr:hypothetical protein D9757_001003 [Collybiopsis confluens]
MSHRHTISYSNLILVHDHHKRIRYEALLLSTLRIAYEFIRRLTSGSSRIYLLQKKNQKTTLLQITSTFIFQEIKEKKMFRFNNVLAMLALTAIQALTMVQASLFVTHPASGSTCNGGTPCIVQWLDDGTSPLNSDIGVATVGLYTANMQLVQSIPAVDVSNSQSLTFTPTPAAGPNSGTYYIAFTSTNLKVNGSKFTGYSPFFNLDNMSGSFSTPDASAISPIPVPSSLSAADASQGSSALSTVTVGSVDTSESPLSTLSATSPLSSSSASSSGSPTASTTSGTNASTTSSSHPTSTTVLTNGGAMSSKHMSPFFDVLSLPVSLSLILLSSSLVL